MTTIISNLIVALFAMIGTLGGAYIANRKSAALLEHRMTQLEEKVSKHNNLVERMYNVEETASLLTEKLKVANHRIDDLEHQEKKG